MAKTAKAGFTFGCDPELFVFNDKDEPVSAAGLIPGTKENPYPVNRGAVQVDGMAAEFNIDPVDNFEDFNTNIVIVIKELKKFLPRGYSLKALPSVVFSEEVFTAAPDEAKVLGCTPDFNAWTGQINPPPNTASNPRMRTASGHLHIGWTSGADLGNEEHIGHCRDLVKQMDWYLGAWSLKKDSDTTRRSLYGKAGACRYKDYGVEYRVLSNFWVTNASTRLMVWDRMMMAIDDMRTSFFPERASFLSEKLIESINTSRLAPSISEYGRYPIRFTDPSYIRV